MTKVRAERTGWPFLPATQKPGSFSLRSTQSRAAARMVLAARREARNEDGPPEDAVLRVRIENARARMLRFAAEQPTGGSV